MAGGVEGRSRLARVSPVCPCACRAIVFVLGASLARRIPLSPFAI